MEENFHDPYEYIRGVLQILISDKKRIGFLFGAGTSLAIKNDKSLSVPCINDLTNDVLKCLTDENKTYGNVFNEIKKELGSDNFDIESLLTNLEQKYEIIGGSTLNSMNKDGFSKLIGKIKLSIKEKMSVHSSASIENIEALVQTDFADWIKQANRKHPIEIFTLNYDYLFELGLEHKNVPYYDGFTGSYQPFFHSESIEDMAYLPKQTKLWKIHGSLGWSYDKSLNKILRKDSNENDLVIYPSMLKYQDSKKLPYISYMDRLSNFIKQDDSVLITCGYSYRDEHINERLTSALNSDTNSHVIALCFSDIVDCPELKTIAEGNNKLSAYGFKDAIIGCKYGKWKLRAEPDKDETPNINLYYDEDAPLNPDDEIGKEKKGEEKWTGLGKFILCDYAKLTSFLNSLIVFNEVREMGKNGK